jgi:hypothetical protein
LNIRKVTAFINERVFLIIVVVIVCGSFLFSYSFYREGKILEQKIVSKQNELARMLELKDIYLSHKIKTEKAILKKDEKRSFSLSTIEEMVSKTFIGGKLAMLKPSTLKEQKGAALPSIELKINNAALNEVVVFLRTLETSGLTVQKLYLTVPQNQQNIDIYIVITER